MPKRSESPEERSRSRSPKRRRSRSPSADADGREPRRRRASPSRSRSRSRSRGRREDRRSRSPARRNGSHAAAAAAAAPAPPPRERKPLAPGRAGGAYIPPFKLAQMAAEAAADDPDGPAAQRASWDALRKSINGLVNKVNASNIKHILPEVFAENLVRGRGLLCRSLMRSQAASPSFTPVYAALVAVINTKFPEIGELLLHRLVTQFKRAFKRNDKPVCAASLAFLAHLINQQVVHELLALEIALLLLETPSDDGVEVCAEFVKRAGAALADLSPAGLTFVFDRLRAILHEGIGVGTRTQYIIEGLYAVRKAGFDAAGFPAVPPELDLVEPADQITHEISLEDAVDAQVGLDLFREDPQYRDHEEKYAAIRREILGEDSDGGDDTGGSGSDEEEDSDEEEGSSDEEGGGGGGGGGARGGGAAGGPIQDHTGTDLVNLRRTIYLTIMSALDFEEAGHKLLKMGIPAGLEGELATMIIECCSQEKTFIKYYALLGERFCKLRGAYADAFADCFVAQYRLIHRLETNKLRNVAKLFAHLLATDALPWAVLSVVRLTEEDTTSSSRIFIKTLFQELAETMGLRALNARLQDPACAPWFEGLFPRDSPRTMRFSINFFTSIGLGGLTDAMRELLKEMPRIIAAQQAAAAERAAAERAAEKARKRDARRRRRRASDSSDSSSSSDSDSDSGSSSSSSGSDTSSSSSSGSDSGTSSGSSSDSSGSESSGDSRGRGRRRGRSGGRGRSRSRSGRRGRSGGRSRSPPRRAPSPPPVPREEEPPRAAAGSPPPRRRSPPPSPDRRRGGSAGRRRARSPSRSPSPDRRRQRRRSPPRSRSPRR